MSSAFTVSGQIQGRLSSKFNSLKSFEVTINNVNERLNGLVLNLSSKSDITEEDIKKLKDKIRTILGMMFEAEVTEDILNSFSKDPVFDLKVIHRTFNRLNFVVQSFTNSTATDQEAINYFMAGFSALRERVSYVFSDYFKAFATLGLDKKEGESLNTISYSSLSEIYASRLAVKLVDAVIGAGSLKIYEENPNDYVSAFKGIDFSKVTGTAPVV